MQTILVISGIATAVVAGIVGAAIWHRYFLFGWLAGVKGVKSLKNAVSKLVKGCEPPDALKKVIEVIWGTVPKPRFVAEAERKLSELRNEVVITEKRALDAIALAKNEAKNKEEVIRSDFQSYRDNIMSEVDRLEAENDSLKLKAIDASAVVSAKSAALLEAEREYRARLASAKENRAPLSSWGYCTSSAKAIQKWLSGLAHLPQLWPIAVALVISIADFFVRYTMMSKQKGPAILQSSTSSAETSLYTFLFFVAAAVMCHVAISYVEKNPSKKEAGQQAAIVLFLSGFVGLLGILIVTTMSLPKAIESSIIGIGYAFLFLTLAFVTALILGETKWHLVGVSLSALPVSILLALACGLSFIATGFEAAFRWVKRRTVKVDDSALIKATDEVVAAKVERERVEAERSKIQASRHAMVNEVKTSLDASLKSLEKATQDDVRRIENEMEASIASTKAKIDEIEHDRRISGFRAGVEYAVVSKLQLTVPSAAKQV